LNALVSIRGAQRITDPNPEEKYQALEKYRRDLTDQPARKLDRSSGAMMNSPGDQVLSVEPKIIRY
jgi:hypothetical protein